jgi:hypothetical protein
MICQVRFSIDLTIRRSDPGNGVPITPPLTSGTCPRTIRVMAGTIDNDVYDRLGESWWDETSLLNILGPRANPVALLRGFARARRRRITYGELGQRMDMGQVRSRGVSNMGFAIKSQ